MVEDSFSAAHQLRGYEGPCEKLHGHTWKVKAIFSGKSTGKLGMVVDFKILKNKLHEAIKELDHGNLNELKQFKVTNPTCENVSKLIFGKLKGEKSGGAKLSKVVVFESPTSSAAYHE